MRPVATGRPSWVSLTSKVSLRAVRSTSWASAWTVAADRAGQEVVQLDVGADGGLARRERGGGGADGRGLGQGERARRAEDLDVTGAEGPRGVRFGHGGRHAGGIGRFTHARTLAQHRRLPGQ